MRPEATPTPQTVGYKMKKYIYVPLDGRYKVKKVLICLYPAQCPDPLEVCMPSGTFLALTVFEFKWNRQTNIRK